MAAAEALHPRDAFVLEGAEAAEAAWLEAFERGRMHHAWMLTGPEGVGKATFAFRAARRLLGAKRDPAYGLTGSNPEDHVSRMISAQSHPDLLVLERPVEDGKVKKVIPVDQARRLPEFFSKAPSQSPWRVAIIDAADDLNSNSANAVLKTLEEPPPRGVLFLVAHAPGRLLPTIRSRCRRLSFRAWEEERLAAWVGDKTGLNGEDSLRIARMAKGAPGRAISLLQTGALDADDAAREILNRLPDADEAALQAMADRFRGQEGAIRYEMILERLADRIHAHAVEDAGETPSASLERWAAAWEGLVRMPAEAEAVNLDRQDSFWTAIGRLRRAAKV